MRRLAAVSTCVQCWVTCACFLCGGVHVGHMSGVFGSASVRGVWVLWLCLLQPRCRNSVKHVSDLIWTFPTLPTASALIPGKQGVLIQLHLH
jgi:hypothetical protein